MSKISNKQFKRICASIMVLTMIFTGINPGVMAQSTNSERVTSTKTKEEIKNTDINIKNQTTSNENKQIKKKPTVVKELKKLRTTDSNTYLLSDGSKKLDIYGQKVRYKKNGKLIDYNADLKELSEADKKELIDVISESNIVEENAMEEYTYVNTAGDAKQYFPKTLDENTGVLLNKDEHSIMFSPTMENDNVENEKTQINVEKSSVSENDITYTHKEKNIEYKYTSYPSGVKEEIILSEKPDSNIFEFSMNLSGMKIKKVESSKALQIIDKKQKKLLHI